MKQHKNMAGVRLFVYKPDRSGYTTVYCNARTMNELLPLAGDNLKALSATARIASLRTKPREGMTWGDCVIAATRSMLKRAQADAERAAAELAAKNNAAWTGA